MKITVKVEDVVCKTLLMSLLIIFVGSNFAAFGQEKKSESQLGRLLIGNSAIQEETPPPTPEATKKPTRERKAEDSNKLSIPQDTPDYSPEVYAIPPPQNLPSFEDYLTEAEKTQKKIDSNNRKQSPDANRQIEQVERESQAERERQQEIQNQIIQQQNDRLNQANEQNRQNALETQKQEEAAKKIEAEQWKWIWLIPLFEILQTIGLAIIAFKYQVAKKSVIAMTVGFGVCLFLYLIVITKLKIEMLPFGLIGLVLGIVSIYAYAVGKLSTYNRHYLK